MQSDIHHSDDIGAREATESSQLASLFSTSNRLARRRYAGRSTGVLTNNNPRYKQMFRILATFALIRAFLQVAPLANAATYDAVNNIEAKFSPYLVSLPNVPRSASEIAAADAAAHDVLVSLYPAFQASLDRELQQDLVQLPDNERKAQGVAVGQAVAAKLLAARSTDGANVTPPLYLPGSQPGDYQLTPPNFAPADFTQWPKVTPFALEQADEFRPGPPPALTSATYTQVFNEVKSLGFIDSTTRTAEQTQIGKFWNGNIQDFWNEIAQTA